MTFTARGWYAWLNKMPPPPDDFHVVGEITVGNPGVRANLTVKQPQGFNPGILLLDLSLVQQPGMWPQVISIAEARFDRIMRPGESPYSSVEIFMDGKSIAVIDKIDVVQ